LIRGERFELRLAGIPVAVVHQFTPLPLVPEFGFAFGDDLIF